MKHFWALPALLRPALVLASQHVFSVNDDILAFPQYVVKFDDSAYLLEDEAQELVRTNGVSNTNQQSELEHYTGRTSHDGHDGDKDKAEQKLEYETMTHSKQRYLCSIPQVVKPVEQPGENDTISKAEQEKELARANDRGWELLAGMQGNCVYYLSGWWSYKFCYNQGIKQFHQLPPARGMPVYPPVEDPSVPGYVLGQYDPDKAKQQAKTQSEEKWEGEGALEVSEHATRKAGGQGELVTRGESRYLVQKLEDGTECDLTGKARKIEVQYHCNPSIGNDRITMIKETSTCAYLMVVQTPRLCNDVAFQPPQKDEPNVINCRPVLLPDEVEPWLEVQRVHEEEKKALEEEQKAYDVALQEAEIWRAVPDAAAAFGKDPNDVHAEYPQIVGDIIIGGREIVPEGVEIEKSAIVGGHQGKEKYVDTIATSWGKAMSKEDLAKLEIRDQKAVEALKKELEKVARGEKWKLDVIDTPNGREYRGIYGKDVEMPDEEGKGEKTDESSSGKGSGEAKKGDGVPPKGGEKDERSKEDGGDEQGSEEEYYKEEL